MRERSKVWDNIKGVLIFLVVFAHFLIDFRDGSAAVGLIFDSIYYFHMPAFAIVSGFFSHEKSKVGKFIPAFVIFNGLFVLLDFAMHGHASIIKPYYCCWYLLALIAWRMIGKHLAKVKFIVPIMFVIALIAGFSEEIDNTFAVSRIIGFFPFFMAGYKLRDLSGKLEDIKRRIKPICGVPIFLLMLLMVLGGKFMLAPAVSDFIMDPYTGVMGAANRAYFFLVACVGIIALYVMMPDKKIPFITKWGRNSMSIFLVHRMVALLFGMLMPMDMPAYIVICGALLGAFLITLALGTDVVAGFINKIIDPFGEGKRVCPKIPAVAVGVMYLMVPVLMFFTK